MLPFRSEPLLPHRLEAGSVSWASQGTCDGRLSNGRQPRKALLHCGDQRTGRALCCFGTLVSDSNDPPSSPRLEGGSLYAAARVNETLPTHGYIHVSPCRT